MIGLWIRSLYRQVAVLKKHKVDSDARIDELLTMVRVTERERDAARKKIYGYQQLAEQHRNVIGAHLKDNADLKASINLYADQVDRQAKEVQVYHRDNAKLQAGIELRDESLQDEIQTNKNFRELIHLRDRNINKMLADIEEYKLQRYNSDQEIAQLRAAQRKWEIYGTPYEEQITQIVKLQDDNAKLRAELKVREASQHVALADADKLRAALEQVEWVYYARFDVYRCPWCFFWKEGNRGHAPDCPRQLALGLADGDRCKT